MVHNPQVENHCTKPTIQFNQADDNTAQFLYLNLAKT